MQAAKHISLQAAPSLSLSQITQYAQDYMMTMSNFQKICVIAKPGCIALFNRICALQTSSKAWVSLCSVCRIEGLSLSRACRSRPPPSAWLRSPT